MIIICLVYKPEESIHWLLIKPHYLQLPNNITLHFTSLLHQTSNIITKINQFKQLQKKKKKPYNIKKTKQKVSNHYYFSLSLYFTHHKLPHKFLHEQQSKKCGLLKKLQNYQQSRIWFKISKFSLLEALATTYIIINIAP